MLKKLAYPIKEAAKMLSVSEITLYRETKKGSVPCRRIGGKVLIPADYINSFATIENGGEA